MAMKRWRTGVRFGIRDPEGFRSSSWTVKGGGDSSVYVSNRRVGRAIKVSLHPRDPALAGADWRIALVGDGAKVEQAVAQRMDGRVLHGWDPEQCRLGDGMPVRKGFAVVLGRFSLARHPEPHDPDELASYHRHLAKVDWIDDVPPIGFAWQFTVLLTDPGHMFDRPPLRSAVPVGTFVLPDGTGVWIVRHQIPVGARMRDTITAAAKLMVDRLGMPEEHSVYRGFYPTTPEPVRAFVEVAVTLGDPEGVPA